MYSTSRTVCRILGGSGGPQPSSVPTRKLPVLCAPLSRYQANAVAPRLALPPALPDQQ